MENRHKQFNAFDKVLVRDAYDKWNCDIYSHYDKDEKKHWSVGFGWVLDNDILPYEGNEHLVGTTDEPEEEVKLEVGVDYIVGIKHNEDLTPWLFPPFLINQLQGYTIFADGEFFELTRDRFRFAIRFKDFNPNDMEETKKYILCVKNGKVVKYKE